MHAPHCHSSLNMTKYVKSREALPAELHMWDPRPTQTALYQTKLLDIPPLTSIESTDTIAFVIPAIPKGMLESVEIVTELRVQTSAGDNLPASSNISTAPHLAAALWRNVVVEIGGQQLTQSYDDCYSMFKFFETIVHHGEGAASALQIREGLLLDNTDDKAGSENVVFYPTTLEGVADPEGVVVNTNGKKRAERIQGKKVCLVSDFDIPIFKQDKFLPCNLEINVSLTKNPTNFILLAAVNDTSKIVVDKVVLRCQFKFPTEVVYNLLEERLAVENAIFHADRNILTYRQVPPGIKDVTINNLFTGTLPYFFYIGVQTRGKAITTNPFSLHQIERIQLYVNGQQHFPEDIESTEDNSYMFSAFLNETGRINGGDMLLASKYDTYPLFAFDLTPDKSQNQHGLNLQNSGNVRLSLGFKEDTKADQILMVLAKYEQVVEITKDREVVLV